MHSSDRTLLASMGFQDKDRTDPLRRQLHDLAIQFVSQKVIVPHIWWASAKCEPRRPALGPQALRRWTVEPEVVIKRRLDFVIGFADLIISDCEAMCEVDTWGNYGSAFQRWDVPVYGPMRLGCARGSPVIVEVKTRIDDPGATVRQVKLYADTNYRFGRPVVVSVEPAPASAIAIIRDANIAFVQLGAKFRDFVQSAQGQAPDLEL